MTLTATVPTRPDPATAPIPDLREMPAATSQQVFRTCLDVLARPGLIRTLPDAVVSGSVPTAVIAPLLALTDLMVPIAGLDWAADGAARQVAHVTGAPVTEPGRARFALALRDSDRLQELSAGTTWSPELGAMLCQRVTRLGEHADTELELSGPGVDGSTGLSVSGLSESFFALRRTMVAAGPTGIDLLLITDDGMITGLPRTTTVTRSGGR